MFTGIVKEKGIMQKKSGGANAFRLQILSPRLAGKISVGGSLAVNGVCLTVARKENQLLTFDVGQETVKRSNLGKMKMGEEVNLEPSLRYGDPLDGHIVQGHIDGVGFVESMTELQGGMEMEIRYPKKLAPFIAEKGSLAVDGVSLTVSNVDKDILSVSLVPFTLRHTNLSGKEVGDSVNIEVDAMARYRVRRRGYVHSV